MIKKVSELLKEIIDEERKKLDEFQLNHGPTIGKMYEGLTSKILNIAIPSELNLRIVSGFIYSDSWTSRQIDCMLVNGEGILIPYTDDYKWHISHVIAVFEVKKTLYKKDLEDAFNHLREIKNIYSNFIGSNNSDDIIDISHINSAFAQMTGIVAPLYSRITELPFDKQQIYHTLVIEQLSPIRVVVGYHGFKSEYSLRKKLIDFLGNNMDIAGFGITSFPHLIISGDYSLIKFNGQPYCPKLRNEQWDFYGSTNNNPIFPLLELIWTKLERLYHIGGFWGEDLEVDNFHPLLSAKAIINNGRAGWAYGYTELSPKALKETIPRTPWQPIYVNALQFVIFNRLCNGEQIRINDKELIDWLCTEGHNSTQFITDLTETALVALDGNKIKLVSEECVCVILPNGKYVVAENNSGRFERWLAKNS